MDMTPKQYRAALAQLGMTQEGFAQLVGATGRTGQRWATVLVPPVVATLMHLLIERPELLGVIQAMKHTGDQR